MNSQPGEICFPGGMIDHNDPSEGEAAIRELCEETGVHRSDVTPLGALDRLVTPFQQIIYPFTGFIKEGASFSPNPAEVETLFTVPVRFFIQTIPERHDIQMKVEISDTFPYEKIPGGKNYPWRGGTIPEFFYEYEGYIIWGLTARIVRHFVQLVKN
ncbi:NUDIX hydrolase [Alteribacillus sp. HJP-4]